MKKTLFIAGALALAAFYPAPAALAAQYGWEAQKAAIGCTAADIGQAFEGNFSRWALPPFIGGVHLKAGQYTEPVIGADGERRCVVRGN